MRTVRSKKPVIKQVIFKPTGFVPPNKFLITSDDNEMEYVMSKDDGYVYVYTKSKMSIGVEIFFTEDNLKKFLRNTFKPINT